MEDYRQNGFDDGYGRLRRGDYDNPESDGDKYSYRDGFDYGVRRKKISDDMENY